MGDTRRAADASVLSIGRALRLARWLGPWAPEDRRPRGISTTIVKLSSGAQAFLHRGPSYRTRGRLLVLPGLHYLGPTDPRLSRFLAILANAGFEVLCPSLPAFERLEVRADVVVQARLALEFLAKGADPNLGIGILGISFGAYPALALAADTGLNQNISQVMLIGAYARFAQVLRSSLPPEVCDLGAQRSESDFDSDNLPVVFINMARWLHPSAAPLLRRTWLDFARCTWVLKKTEHRLKRTLAFELAQTIPDDARELFLQGCGVADGARSRVESALEGRSAELSEFDLEPLCARIRVPVSIMHGVADAVIPVSHAHVLVGALRARVPTRLLLTGLYGHTGLEWPGMGAIAQELRTMAEIVQVMAELNSLR